jgi:hypothetical protein
MDSLNLILASIDDAVNMTVKYCVNRELICVLAAFLIILAVSMLIARR